MSDSRMNLLYFNLVNGFSYMCLGETILILFAVRLNAPNAIVAILGSMMYLGYLLLPLGKIMTARVGAAQCQADFWVMRNLAVLLVASAAPVSLFLNSTIALILLVTGSFFFYGFRAAGVVMSQPLIAEVCKPEIRGKYLSIFGTTFYATGMIALVLISLILKTSDSIWLLTGIILLGAVMGISASVFVRRICETDQIMVSARKPIRETLRRVISDRSILHQMVAGMVCNLMYILTVPISMLALKRGYHISDTGALFYSLIQFGIMVIAGFLQARVAGKLGPRRLILIGYWLVPFIAVFWLLVPSTANPFLNIIPFLFCGIVQITLTNGLVFYFVMSVRKDIQVVASMLISVATGVGSGLTGMLFGSLLLKLAEFFDHSGTPLHLYKIYFGMVMVLFVLGAFFVHRLDRVIDDFRKEHDDHEVRQTIQDTAKPHH